MAKDNILYVDHMLDVPCNLDRRTIPIVENGVTPFAALFMADKTNG